ncbi:MAG: Kelch repeat-containing protein [Leptospirales bacterium]
MNISISRFHTLNVFRFFLLFWMVWRILVFEPASAAETGFQLDGWAPEAGKTIRIYQIDPNTGQNGNILDTIPAGKKGAFHLVLPTRPKLPVRLQMQFPSSCGKVNPSPVYSALILPENPFDRTGSPISIGFQSTLRDQMTVFIHSRHPEERHAWTLSSVEAKRRLDLIFGSTTLDRTNPVPIDRADQIILSIIAGWLGGSSWDWGFALARDLSDSRADGQTGDHHPLVLCNRPVPPIAGTVFWRKAVLTALAKKRSQLSPENQIRLAHSAERIGLFAPKPSGIWKTLPPMPTPRDSILVVSGPNVPPTVIGGEAPRGVSNAVERWYPAKRLWDPLAPYPLSVSYAAGTALPDGRIFVTGGFNSDGFTGASYLYLPGTGRWTAVAPDPVPRAGASAVLLPDGEILVTGGETGNGITNLTARFNVDNNRWYPEAGAPEGRIGGVSALMPDGRVLVLGGLLKTGGITGVGRYYNPRTRRWEETTPPAPTARLYGTGSLMPDGTLVFLDGFNRTGVQNSMDSFDPVLRKWKTALPPDLVRRKETGSAVLEEGSLFVVGGEVPDGTSVGKATLFH